jgi:hypothetical protein
MADFACRRHAKKTWYKTGKLGPCTEKEVIWKKSRLGLVISFLGYPNPE